MSTPAPARFPVGGSWIQTFQGNRIDPLNPRTEDIDARDIAHALAMQCRFTGHTRFHYSVAQHTVLMIRCLTRRWPNPGPHSHQWDLDGLGDGPLPKLARAVALHDASEAYLCDIARPVKHSDHMDGYRDAEARLDDAIALRFGVLQDPEIDKRIRQLDGRMLVREAYALIGGTLEGWGITRFGEPADVVIEPWTPSQAEHAMLDAFARLGIV